MKKQLHQDVYIGLVCLALCLLIFALNMNLSPDAAMMPRLLGGILTVLSILIIYRGLNKSKLPVEAQGAKALTLDALKIPLITWGFVVLYFVLFMAVGYFLATGVMIIVLMRFMKRTSWPIIITIDITYLLLIYFVFVRMLNVSVDGFGMLGQLL
ncbi:tripartite tricarboxylate transporter TctB family protein [Oscillospiraceae bacterium LTW-04]|nr:tripartite tricarboxylate transporter TctB family protein [Oscillospiraceae bacterium MB24-C1]